MVASEPPAAAGPAPPEPPLAFYCDRRRDPPIYEAYYASLGWWRITPERYDLAMSPPATG